VINRRNGCMALDTGLPEEPRHAPEGMQRGTRERVPLAKIVRENRRNFISFVLHAHILRSSLRGVRRNRNYAAAAKDSAAFASLLQDDRRRCATIFSLLWSWPRWAGQRVYLCLRRFQGQESKAGEHEKPGGV
jgi:hypothetical protein